LQRIGKITKRGVEILKGRIVSEKGKENVSVILIKFILPQDKDQAVIIDRGQVDKKKDKDNQIFFVDIINRQIVFKSKNPTLY